MPSKTPLAASIVVALSLAGNASRASQARFHPHDIAELPSGYAVSVADFDNDGRIDVIANSLAVPSWRGTRTRRGSVTLSSPTYPAS